MLTDWPGNGLAGLSSDKWKAHPKTVLDTVDSGFQGVNSRSQLLSGVRIPRVQISQEQAKISRDSGIIWITLQKRIEKIEYGTETFS